MKNFNRGIFIALFALITVISCKNDKPMIVHSDFVYPQSKVWAHKTNDTVDANTKAAIFDGLEFDVTFAKYDSTIYVGHELVDSINKLTIQKWFAALNNPTGNNYWIDVKNLELNNAQPIADQINDIIIQYGLKGKIIVESPNVKPLIIVKKAGIPVSYWTNSVTYWPNWNRDTLAWYRGVKKNVDKIIPDAISCDYEMYDLLTKYFPEQNIHLWQTPMEYSPENAELTKEMCRNSSVKVVLVDFDAPVDYE